MDERGIKKILVIRFSSLGDVVLTTAIFPNLRAHFKDTEIFVLTKREYSDVFLDNPSIDHVLLFDEARQPFSELMKEIRAHQFDVIIDLHGNLRSWMIRFVSGPAMAITVKKHRWARQWLLFSKKVHSSLTRSVREKILDCLFDLDVPVISQETQLFPGNPASILEMYDINPQHQLIGIAPGAQHRTKQWGVDQFAEAANRLGAFPNTTIVLFGSKSESSLAEKILPQLKISYKNLMGWTNLRELTAVMSRLSLLVCNDSGLMHMAEALKVPVVALYGPTVRGFGFYPYRSTSRVVEVVNLSCRPCSLHGDDVCPLKHHQCMTDIDVNAVLYASSDVLKPL